MLDSITRMASALHREVARHHKDAPQEAVIAELLETLFLVSLETEEGEPITLHIAYLDPAKPDPSPPPHPPPNRWSCVKLVNRVPLTVPALAKLAKASDPRTSSFAVFASSDSLFVWGLIDQGNHYHEFVNFNTDTGPERPGWFQVSVSGLGRLNASIGYVTVAEVRVNSVLTQSVDALRAGPLRERLQPGIDDYLHGIKTKLETELRPRFEEGRRYFQEIWIETLCRLLLRAQNYRHGGALLIAGGKTWVDLDVKYAVGYDRLSRAMVAKGIHEVEEFAASDEIMTLMDEDEQSLPTGLYVDEWVSRDEVEGRRSEIDSAIWFISLLTRVDGLVLLDNQLGVHGFGVEIRTPVEPPNLYLAPGPRATEKSLRRVDPLHYGTRHRSMMRFCSAHAGTIGLVISQDGHVRAVTMVGSKLVMWENLRLQLPQFARRPKRRRN